MATYDVGILALESGLGIIDTGGLADRPAEVLVDPLADEVVGDGDLQPVLADVHPRGVAEPNAEPLLADPLGNRVRQAGHLRIELRHDAAHESPPTQ